MKKIKIAAKIDKNYFNYERIGRDMWEELANKAQDSHNIYWNFENDEAIKQKNITIETPEDAWGPEEQFDKKASFRCELRFAGGDWEQGVFYFCCQGIKGKTFHTDECFVLIPTKEQGNLGLIKNDKGKWYSSQGDEKDVEYSHEKAEKQCWESLPEMLHEAKEAKIEEHKKISMCLPKEVVAFDNTSEAIQYLADYTNNRIVIAGYEEQKPNIIEKLKKHKSTIKDEEIEELLESFQKADPVSSKTKGKKSPFTEQIVKWYISNKIRLPEDIETIKNTLTQYSKYKGKIKKKIDHFNSPGDLRKKLERYLDEPANKSDYDSIADVVMTDGEYKMYLIEDYDEQGKVCFKDSGWCVQNKSHFDQYKPPYYMITKGKKRYALLHKNSYQLKDVNDNSLTTDQAKPIEKLIKSIFPKWKPEDDLARLMSLYGITEAEQLEAIKQNGFIIKLIENPTEKMKLEAVKSRGTVILHIKNPTEEMKLEAVKEDGLAILFIPMPTEEMQLEAVKENASAIQYIKKPTEAVQLGAMKEDGFAIKYLDNPSEAVQMEAVKSHKDAIKYIKNPSKAAIEMANKKAASIKFASINEAIQYLADYTDNRIVIAEDPIPTHLYHATYKPLLPSIKRKGLIKNYQNKNWEDSKDFIYLATSKDIAESYAETSDIVPEEWIDQIVVFKVDTDKLDLNQLSTDKNVQHKKEVSTYQYNKNIPFSNLKIEE